MRLREIFRFEVAYQARQPSTWLYLVVLLGLTFLVAGDAAAEIARDAGSFANSPLPVAVLTLLGSLIGLLAAPALAGDAGARDVQTRMHPLLYTTPVGRAAYLGGRFLAAFVLNALILVAVPAALLLALLSPGMEAQLVGPFRPAAYLGPYLFLALPNAFVATALQFSLAAFSRRVMASYLGSVLVCFAAAFSLLFVAQRWGRWELAKLLDPLGFAVIAELGRAWTPIERSTRLIGLEGSLLANRLLWVGVALGVLALTHLRFRFTHHEAGAGWNRHAGWWNARSAAPDAAAVARGAPVAVPRVPRTFGAATHARQALAIGWRSFREVATGPGGLALVALASFLVLIGPEAMEFMGLRQFPTTEQMTSLIVGTQDVFGVAAPLLIIFYAGELIWRERESGLGEIADAAPVPDPVSFLGRLVGIGMVIVALQALLTAAAMLVQVRLGYHEFELGLYLQILFGLQLADHLLLALLALVVHVVVDQKHVGHLVALTGYLLFAAAPALGIEHNLLVYASDPGWEYSDMRGLDPFLGPWLWFKLYWAAWALLLAVVARLLWVRGRERGLGPRLRLARRRFTRPVVGAVMVAVGLVLTLGGFVFYNTNVLNEYRTASERMEQRAEYERRYGRYEGIPQPRLTGTNLHVEIYPGRGEVEIRGAHLLVNRGTVAIDSVHLATIPRVETGAITFDRPAALVLADEEFGHRIYALERPLQPGDSLRLGFRVRFDPRGFPHRGVDASVAENGTFFTAEAWLPAIGYQPDVELSSAAHRRAHGLPPRPAFRSLHDAAARRDMGGQRMRIAFEAVVGTDEDQIAVAPGRLHRTWTEGGRRYFHYATDAPIRPDYAFFSAAYAVRQGRWKEVEIQIVHHPDHAWNVERMLRSVHASLDHLTRNLGPYPHGQIRLVEHPGPGSVTLHAAPINIWYREGFSVFHPEPGRWGVDLPFAVVAHEVAHQWWGGQLTPAPVEGRGVLTESLAWYSALGVVEEAYGPEHLRRLLRWMREVYLSPRARADVPLLRAYDWFNVYRKGAFAMYALREYVGEEPVNTALRRLLAAYGSGEPPLATSLDLYRELQAVTPDSLRYLLRDLFEANTFWELAAEAVQAEPAAAGAWRVTLEVRARKVVVDTAGVETEVPMDDLVEIGVFAAAEDGGPGEPLYLRMHRVRSGTHRVAVTVPGKPARAGVDPRGLLIDVEPGDHLEDVRLAGALFPRHTGRRR